MTTSSPSPAGKGASVSVKENDRIKESISWDDAKAYVVNIYDKINRGLPLEVYEEQLLQGFPQELIDEVNREEAGKAPLVRLQQLREQVASVVGNSLARDDIISLQHTFKFELNAAMLAGYVRAMGGDPNAPSPSQPPEPKKRWWWPW